MQKGTLPAQLGALVAILDAQAGRYLTLNGGRDFGEYLAEQRVREDEELLTEPILADIIERVLEFPRDAYFPQLSRSGLKPDFTPIDLVAHRFVLDAKSSMQDLAGHERQIRGYVDHRHLDFGVLFNLRELRVYRRGTAGHDPRLSFDVLRLWRVARGEALDTDEVDRFVRFCGLFGHRAMGTAQKITQVAEALPWRDRISADASLQIDLDFLVGQLRSLSRVLADDAAAERDRLLADLEFNPDHERRLRLELETLAREIEPAVDVAALPLTVAGYADQPGVAGRAWVQYLMRVSQLTLTRILLYRSWEDAGFVEDCLYDGGFGQVYERLDRNLQRVLDEAFQHGRARYRWLFGEDNNYDWYRPRDDALADVLYALVPLPLARLGADVLGGLYESYVDEIDRDRLGQFYTPRAVVRFMLNRVGFSGPDGVFRIEGDERHERTVFDFATGSGGFLVEAARRVIDDAGLDLSDARDLREGLRAIVRGFHGCEISPFPYYLTEVNLLLQVSRLLGRLREVGEKPPGFTLGVVHTDSLGARAGSGSSFAELDAKQRADAAVLAADERYGIVELDAAKQPRFDRMREDGTFDLVIGNPPYVGEAGNKVLFDRLRALPGWRNEYRGKGDYLYYFLAMAAEKLAPGGRLCVITPAAWMNSSKADWLRERLASELRLDELFLFGSMRLFATERDERDVRTGVASPLIESAILVATKAEVPPDHRLRVVVLTDETAAARALTGDPAAKTPPREPLLTLMAARAEGRRGRATGVLVHDLVQAQLRSVRPWPVKHTAGELSVRVVAHLERALGNEGSAVERLDVRWVSASGIETGADAFSSKIQRRLDEKTRSAMASAGFQIGDPILQLPAGAESSDPWRHHPEILARAPEGRAILYGAIDTDDYTSLVWIGRDDEVPPAVREALEPWREVLRTRAEFRRNHRRKWWETAWARDRAALRGPKVIALHRTARGRFALDEEGSWQATKNATTVVPREKVGPVAYLCGVLNSELLDLWYAVRGRVARDVWRDYEPTPMNAMPYRHVPVPNEWTAGEHVDLLRAALLAADVDAAVEAAARVRNTVGEDQGDADARAAIEHLVRAISANRSALLSLRHLSSELTRAVKNPWRTHGVHVDPAGIVADMPAAAVRSVRLDPDMALEILTDGVLGRATVRNDALVFTHARKPTARVEGPIERVDLLASLLGSRRMMPDDLRAARLPTSLDAFEAEVGRRQDEVDALLNEGRVLVEAVERLVCKLYGVPDPVADLVVESAITRAGTVAQDDD